MDTLEHIKKVLPEQGLKVLAMMKPRTDKEGNVLLKSDGSKQITTWHKTFETVEKLNKAINTQKFGVDPLFIAMGGYDPERSFIERTSKTGKKYKGFSRSANFTVAFRSLWLDIDCGESKAASGEGYVSQQVAVERVLAFVTDLNLPRPMLVSSGGGLHVYWTLDKDLNAESWFKAASILEAIVKHYGLLADPACTTDKARILRPIGTTNHKYGTMVQLIEDAPSININTLLGALLPYYKAHKPEIKKLKTKKSEPREKTSFSGDSKPRHAKYFLKRCQVGNYSLVGEEPLAEPVWRGVISILRHCKNGEKHLETLRSRTKSRFPDTTRFDEDRTTEKLNWFIDHDLGPFLCDTFQKECPQICAGCPHAIEGRINTPLSLAEHYEEVEIPQYNLTLADPTTVEEVVEVEETPQPPQPPYPFIRSEKGLVILQGDQETLFFKGDMFPVMTRFVEEVDGEINIMVKYLLRVGLTGGYQTISFPMKDWYALDKIKQRLGAAGVSIADKNMQSLILYMRKYQEEVHDKMDVVKQIQHFGWVERTQQFLLGETLYRPEGQVAVQPHFNVKSYCNYFKSYGTLENWKLLMGRLAEINATEQQICMLSSFGSTLMRFTNYNGIWLHLMTKPGYGKTTTQEMMNGIWGNPSDLLLNAKDTVNAIEERFGRWANIGVTIDELSNLDPRLTSDLLLGVTQGRTKRRLNGDMRERVDNLSWQLMVLSSGNFSLIDRISSVKDDCAAEISRTLEFQLPKPVLSVHEGEQLIKKPIRENYGVAGPVWLENLSRIPTDTLQKLVDTAVEKFSSQLEATSDERFWVTAVAVIYVAGTLTNKMGLTDWNLSPIFEELCLIVKSNRTNKATYEFSATDVLASFLADNTRNTVVTDVGVQEGSSMIKLFPQGALNVRYEQDSGKVFIRTAALKEYCAKRGIGVNSVKQSLEAKGLLADKSVRMVLSKGLPQTTGRASCLGIKVDDLLKSTLDSVVEVSNA